MPEAMRNSTSNTNILTYGMTVPPIGRSHRVTKTLPRYFDKSCEVSLNKRNPTSFRFNDLPEALCKHVVKLANLEPSDVITNSGLELELNLTSFRFLDLPGELRNQIMDLVKPELSDAVFEPDYRPDQSRDSLRYVSLKLAFRVVRGLLQSNRQLRREYTPVFREAMTRVLMWPTRYPSQWSRDMRSDHLHLVFTDLLEHGPFYEMVVQSGSVDMERMEHSLKLNYTLEAMNAAVLFIPTIQSAKVTLRLSYNPMPALRFLRYPECDSPQRCAPFAPISTLEKRLISFAESMRQTPHFLYLHLEVDVVNQGLSLRHFLYHDRWDTTRPCSYYEMQAIFKATSSPLLTWSCRRHRRYMYVSQHHPRVCSCFDPRRPAKFHNNPPVIDELRLYARLTGVYFFSYLRRAQGLNSNRHSYPLFSDDDTVILPDDYFELRWDPYDLDTTHLATQ